MVCPDCGKIFNVSETRAEYNSFGIEDPTIMYDNLPYHMCYDCAKRYVDAIFQSSIADEDQEDIWTEMNQNPTGEYYTV